MKLSNTNTRLPGNYQNLREQHGKDSPSQPSEGTNFADTLVSGFQPPEPWANNFCCLNQPAGGPGYDIPSKWIQFSSFFICNDVCKRIHCGCHRQQSSALITLAVNFLFFPKTVWTSQCFDLQLKKCKTHMRKLLLMPLYIARDELGI